MLFLNIIVFYLSFFVLLVSLDSLMCFVDMLCILNIITISFLVLNKLNYKDNNRPTITDTNGSQQ